MAEQMGAQSDHGGDGENYRKASGIVLEGETQFQLFRVDAKVLRLNEIISFRGEGKIG